MPIKKYSHDQIELQLGQNLCTKFDFIQQNDDPNQSVDFYANILYYVDTQGRRTSQCHRAMALVVFFASP